jgi:hypothetical protein
MPGPAPLYPVVGNTPIGDFFIPDTTQRWTLGEMMDAVDPYFGGGTYVYGKAASAVAPGRLMYPSETWTFTDLPSTAGQGYPFAVAKTNMAINTFGWFQVYGVCPVQAAQSVATGVAAAVSATGQAGTLANGKQLLNFRVLQASTFTLTKTGITLSGSPIIQVSNVDGLFYGLTPSGTGVGAGTINAIDASGRQFTNSANSTATGGGITITFTYTNYILAFIQNPFAQGQVA